MAVQRDDLPTLEIRISRASDTTYGVELRLGEREFPRGTLGPDILLADAVADRGARLFERFTADEPVRMAWNLAAALHPQRRIRLRLDDLAPALHTLPWEGLTDTSPTATARTLAADRDTPFARHVVLATTPPGPLAAGPLKILSAVAAPSDLEAYSLPPIDRAAEAACITDALAAAPAGLVQHTHLAGPCTLAALEAELEKGYHLLHLVAHGGIRRSDNSVATFFENQDGKTDRVDAARFAAMIERLSPTLRLVVLISCHSATRSRTDARAGLAPQLLAAGVPAVLAMQDLVPVITAHAFTLAFYRELWTTGELDRAANRARAVVLTARLPGDAIPVLYSAPASNRLWLPEALTPAAKPAPAPTRPVATPVAAPSWNPISGHFEDVQVVREHDGRLTTIAINNKRDLVTCSQVSPGGAWGEWIKQGDAARVLRVIMDNRGRLALFGLDTDGAAHCRVQKTPAGAWGEWVSLGGTFKDIIPAVYADNSLAAFAIDADNLIHELTQDGPDTAWPDEWNEFGGCAEQLVVLRDPEGSLELFAVNDSTIHHCYEAEDGSWIEWYEFEGDGEAQQLALLATRTNVLHLFAIGLDGALWHAARPMGDDWSEWHSLGGDHVDIAVVEVDGNPHVLTAGRDGAAWTIQTTDHDEWSDWTRLGAVRTSKPTPGELPTRPTDFVRVRIARSVGNTTRKYALDRTGQLYSWSGLDKPT